jgi:uncharacterized protein
MPIVSKYSNERVEKIIEKLVNVLVEEQVSSDLALMCLGNAVSHVLNSQVPPANRAKIANNFANALQKSVAITK